MSKYASRTFWVDTFDRSVSTFAQASLAVLTADATGIVNVDWPQVLSVGGLAAIVAIAQAIAFRGKTTDE